MLTRAPEVGLTYWFLFQGDAFLNELAKHGAVALNPPPAA
jgi:hypothetical protein